MNMNNRIVLPGVIWVCFLLFTCSVVFSQPTTGMLSPQELFNACKAKYEQNLSGTLWREVQSKNALKQSSDTFYSKIDFLRTRSGKRGLYLKQMYIDSSKAMILTPDSLFNLSFSKKTISRLDRSLFSLDNQYQAFLPVAYPEAFFILHRFGLVEKVEENEQMVVYHYKNKKLEISRKDSLISSVSETLETEQGTQYQAYFFSKQELSTSPDKDLAFFSPASIRGEFTSFTEADYASRKPLAVGEPVPGIAFKDLNGREFRLGALRDTVLILDFWYMTCMPCLKAMPELQAVHQAFANRPVKVIGINPFDKSDEEVKSFLQKRGITYEVAFPVNIAETTDAFGVRQYPTFFVVDKQGFIAHNHIGITKNLEKELTALVERLLTE